MTDFVDPIDRLTSQLMTSGLQVKDFPLFQVISQLIKSLQKLQQEAGGSITTIINNAGAAADATYITVTDETALLPFSRRLDAGSGITIDISVAGVITISASGGAGNLTVLSNGDPINPELIFANGEVIMVPTP